MMNSRLLKLIRAYQARVRWAVEQLVNAGFPMPVSNTDWATHRVAQRGELPGVLEYFKHGYGCAIRWPKGTLDFDFGENGEITGVDAWRLWTFRDAGIEPHGFGTEEEFNLAFRQAISDDYLMDSGYILYYVNEPKVRDEGRFIL